MKVVPLDAPAPGAMSRTGFLPGISVPADFDQMGNPEIEALFKKHE